MWRSRTELDRALDPDGLGGQVGEEVSGAGWRGPGRTGVGDLGREPQVGEETAAPVLAGAASDIGDPAKLEAMLIDGQKVDVEQWKGKVVMVNFVGHLVRSLPDRNAGLAEVLRGQQGQGLRDDRAERG